MPSKVKALLMLIVAVVLVTGAALWMLRAQRVNTAEAAEFSMEAPAGDSQGIEPGDPLLLKSSAAVDESQLRKGLTVSPQVEFTVRRDDAAGKSFKITPVKPLEPGKVYSFQLAYGEHRSYQWAFQTKSKFRVLGSLPRNQATAVPINTGIELVFSHEGLEDPASYFSIEPKVPGSFEIHKKSLVFVPRSLKQGTIYKVTLKAGLPLKDSTQVLEEDWEFSFETESPVFRETSFEILQNTGEFIPTEPPFFQVYLANQGEQGTAVPVNVAVYRYPGSMQFVEALRHRESIPWWAYYGRSTFRLDTSGLQQLTTFRTEPRALAQFNDRYVIFPESLPAGFYLAEFQAGGQSRQALFQVTGVSAYVTVTANRTLVWLHDLATKEPVNGATLAPAGERSVSTTDAAGVAVLATPKEFSGSQDNRNAYLQVRAPKGRELVIPLTVDRYLFIGENNASGAKYWKYLYLDRGLYLPEDTVRFWGIIKPREAGTTNPGKIQARLTRWESFSYMDGPTVLLTRDVELKEHNFTGELKLPGLKPGYYQFQIVLGDQVLIDRGFEVKLYTKPAYKIFVKADKRAAFAGDTVNYDVRATFYEGTPVAGIELKYNTNRENGEIKVDEKGQARVAYSPTSEDNSSLYQYNNFNVRTSLPEAGEITAESGLLVFPNDVQLRYTQQVENDQATLDLRLHQVELDRYNRGEEDSPDSLLGKPVAGRVITGTITELWWEQIPDGEYYDYINKTVQKRYRHEQRTRAVSSFTVTTGAGGEANYTFPLGDRAYEVKMVTKDQRGRNLNRTAYFQGKGFREPGQDNYRYYHLEPKDPGKRAYQTGETVELTMWENNGVMDDRARSFLFFTARQGLLDYQVQDSPLHTFPFQEKYIPNIFVKGVYFDGREYREAYEYNAVFDRTVKALQVEVRPDREEYRPGDLVRLKVSVRDRQGKPQKARVNLNLVDEALYALQDQHVDLLQSLYQDYVPPLILSSWSSHRVPNPAGGAEFGGEGDGERKNFQDAIYFDTVTTGQDGLGEASFKLPDNLTSWRVTYQAYTGTLQAGSGARLLPVKLPFFVEMVANGTYLAGDRPQVIVRSYGGKLQQDEKVNYRAKLTGPGGKTTEIVSAGKAYQPANLGLPILEKGEYTLTVTATTPGGLKDTLQKGFRVLDSYQTRESVSFRLLQTGLEPAGSGDGLTTLVFTDMGRGQYYQVLQRFLTGWGNRLEQKLATQLAGEWLKSYFQEDSPAEEWEPMQYQTPSGGLAILPYSSEDLGLSVRVAALDAGGFDRDALSSYFTKVLDAPDTDREQAALALWGLAALDEPVLVAVNSLLRQADLSLNERLYLALASMILGNGEAARKVFADVLQRYGQERGTLYRLDAGRDQDEVLEATSLAAVIAARLDAPEQDRIFKYINENYPREMLINLETLLYLKEVLPGSGGEDGGFSYVLNGKETNHRLKAGQRVTLVLDPGQLQQTRFTKVSGRVGMTAIFSERYQPGAQDGEQEISLSRTYEGASGPGGAINRQDLIKVILSYRIPDRAPDGLYLVTDYLPSGLKPVERGWGWDERAGDEAYPYPLEIDGQKITFQAGKHGHPFSYYARVVSPGNFTAEGATIYHTESGAILGLTANEQVIIN